MPITPTNVTKSSTTYTRTRKAGMPLWNDSLISWDSAAEFWDGAMALTNITKNSITPTNVTQN